MELLIVMTIMPLIIGALALSMISVLTLQPKAGHVMSDASNAQIVGADFERDVQSSTNITTASSSSPQCGSGFQILGLQISNGADVISYVRVLSSSGYVLERLMCQTGSATPQSTIVLASDIPSSTPPVAPTLNCANLVTSCSSAPTSWASTSGVTSVSVAIPVNSGPSYSVAATPVLWNANGGGGPGGVPGGGSPLFPFISFNTSTTNCASLTMTDGVSLSVGSGNDPLKVDSPCSGAVQLQDSSLSASELVSAAATGVNSYSANSGSTPRTLTQVYQAVGTSPFASLTAPTNPTAAGSGSCVSNTCSPGHYATSPSLHGGTVNFGAGTYVFDQPVDIYSGASVNFGAGTYWFKGGLSINGGDDEGEGTPTVNFGAGTYLFGNSAGDTCPTADGQSTCLDIGHGSTLATASAGALLYIESGGADISTDSPTSLLGSSSYDGIAVWDASASGTKDPLNIQNGGRSTTTLGGIYVPNGETDITGDGTVNATFLATNTAILANGQIGLG